MKASQAYVGARGVDCVTTLDSAAARNLSAAGIDFAVRYIGSLTAGELAAVLGAGLACMPVTYADRFDGPAAVAELRALGVPIGTTCWLDVEGVAALPPTTLIADINAWADAMTGAGYEPGLYVGSAVPLTSSELYSLRTVRYWHSMSRIVDRNGALAEPMCGWCMHQLFDTQTIAGIQVDVNFIGKDWAGRMPSWIVGTASMPSEAVTQPDLRALPRQP
jgi:hypothetical protein